MVNKLELNKIKLLKQLKGDLQYPFGMLSSDEQALLMDVGMENCSRYEGYRGWQPALPGAAGNDVFNSWDTYKIRSDYYSEQPEYDVCEVTWGYCLKVTHECWRFRYHGEHLPLDYVSRFKFAGCQFLNQDPMDAWWMDTSVFIDETGHIIFGGKLDWSYCKPAVPVRVRFVK